MSIDDTLAEQKSSQPEVKKEEVKVEEPEHAAYFKNCIGDV